MRLRFWRMSEPTKDHVAELAINALADILNFVSDELDRERGPWEDYFTDPETQTLVRGLEKEYRTSEVQEEEDEEDVDSTERMADVSRGRLP